MRKFFTFLIFTLLLGILSSFLINLRYESTYPKQLGVEFDDNLRLNHRDYLNAEKPEMVMIGDSTLRDSVIFDQLGETLGIGIGEMAVPGSSSALWYLFLKNNIITAEHKPAYLVLFTRETLLTTPEYRVNGSIFITIDEYAASDEPLLLERSYMQQMSPLEQLASRYLPLFGEREQVRGSIDYRINNSLPKLFNCGETCVNQILHDIFAGAVDTDAILAQQNLTENYLWGIDKLLFSRQLDRSYLPEFERMTRENDIQLILVEMKTFRSPPSTTISLLRRAYLNDLRAYCANNDIVYISFTEDPRLSEELYSDGFHLVDEAMPMFTDMLAEELEEIVQQN
jgi:hypothetical protein